MINSIEELFYNKILATEQHLSEDYIYPVMVWEKVMEEFPDLFYDDPNLYYFIACCYYQLGEYENAIEYYSIVIDTWPDYRYALGAQRLTDVCFGRLTDAEQ